MAVIQPLIDLAQLCLLQGVTRAVISPGSRSAALTLAFVRNPNIDCQVVMDERAAGFIALGMAQQLNKPVVLICTSGSAAYNFAPAVAEAYFQQIPLLILTADRPKEWINQNDGQTIYQTEIYGKHIKGFWEFPADYSHADARWFINRSVNEALLTAQQFPFGPVHINVPIREPFYPQKREKFTPSTDVRVIHRTKTRSEIDADNWRQILVEWEGSKKKLIAVGQKTVDEDLDCILYEISKEFYIPVVGDVISNLSKDKFFVSKHDFFLERTTDPNLKPDLLITAGQSFISKSFKQFLRNYPPKYHWHISEDEHTIDPFQTLTRQVPVSAKYFFSKIFDEVNLKNIRKGQSEEKCNQYKVHWLNKEKASKSQLLEYISKLTMLDDITAVEFILKSLSGPSQLHLANSMAIRYANYLGIDNQKIKVHCNRGTSGIDGCVSTAIGAAMTTNDPVYLIVGDVAFLYDRNGLLIEDLPDNLKIVLINNGGGTIFRLIEGPASQPELEKYFETRHQFTAMRTAEDSGIEYFWIEEAFAPFHEHMEAAWRSFVECKNTALLEIMTDPKKSAKVFQEMKKFVNKEQ